MIYLDTSAFLKLYIRESNSQVVQAHVISQDVPLPVWELHQAGILNALQLKPECFISFDERQRELASEAGLNVLPEH